MFDPITGYVLLSLAFALMLAGVIRLSTTEAAFQQFQEDRIDREADLFWIGQNIRDAHRSAQRIPRLERRA